MIEKYEIEDWLVAELRKMPGFIRVDDNDISSVWFEGKIDVGKLAEVVWTWRRTFRLDYIP